MFRVPTKTLLKLTCVHCDGYLTSAPIMISNQSKQSCGKCFKILPEAEKCLYSRVYGLEAVAALLIFPCRYNLQGCNYEFLWGHEKDHEADCPYRHNTLPIVEDLDSETPEIKGSSFACDSEMLYSKFTCKKMGGDKLWLNIEIAGNEARGHELQIVAPSSRDRNNTTSFDMRLNVETILSPKSTKALKYCHVGVEKRPSNNVSQGGNIYESLGDYQLESHCSKCRKPIGDEIYFCLFGHNTCKTCKGLPCLLCGRMISNDSYKNCKNFARGCLNLCRAEDLERHETDCEFNDFKCPLFDCLVRDTTAKVSRHFISAHKEKVHFSNTITQRFSREDSEIFFYCHDVVFHCKYYFYDDFLEFLMKYNGTQYNAGLYKYSVSVDSDFFKGKKKQRAKCLGWNETCLGKAVTFYLKNEHFYTFSKFDATITISK